MTKYLLGAVKLKATVCIKVPRPQLNGLGRVCLGCQCSSREKQNQTKQKTKLWSNKDWYWCSYCCLKQNLHWAHTPEDPSSCLTVQQVVVLSLAWLKMSSCLSIPVPASAGRLESLYFEEFVVNVREKKLDKKQPGYSLSALLYLLKPTTLKINSFQEQTFWTLYNQRVLTLQLTGLFPTALLKSISDSKVFWLVIGVLMT